MKCFLAILLTIVSLAGPVPAGQLWTVDAIMNIPTVGDPQISPSGKFFAYTRRKIEKNAWVSTVYMAPVGSGAAISVAKGGHPRWSPDSGQLAYIDSQVHVFDVTRRTSATVTHAPSPISNYTWTADSRGIAYLSVDPGPELDPIVADRDYRFSRLYMQPVSGGEPRRLTIADRHVISFALSPEGTRAVYAAQPTPRNRDALDVDLYELNLRDLSEKALVTQPGRDADPSYSPDGKQIAFNSQSGTLNYFEARNVALVPSGGGPIRYLTQHPNIPIDVFRGGNSFSWSPDGRYLYYTAGHGTRDYLVRQDISSRQIQRVAGQVASAPSFTPDLARGVFLCSSTSGPPEVALLEGSAESRLTNVGDTLVGLPEVQSKVVSWKSRDGLSIEGVLYLPFGYTTGHRVPLLVELHGGPTGAALDSFPIPRTYPTQVFLQKGYAMLVPNFRGSANYGPEFRLKNIDSQGFGDFDDVMTGVDSLIQQGIADPNRLGVMGWSYGGFLTAWVIGHTNRFKVASVGAPATDWTSYYGQSNGPRSTMITYFGGTPWDKPDSYSRHSPRAGLANVRTPTLLQIGAMDVNHNSEIYWALTDHKIPVEYVVYPREPHGFTEPAHQRDLMERNLRWFSRWLQ
ncbi:MAG: prolyl oligopeptidase family serine peptidase [Bryobacteraceae bacterium]